MRWVIKNPAPVGTRGDRWGDAHFGRSLVKYLDRLGHETHMQFMEEWGNDTPCDAVLLLRGKHAFPRADTHRDAVRVIWNISHPSDVTLAEYASHDMVFVASESLAASLRQRIDVPVHALRQCTDIEQFHPVRDPSETDQRNGVVFVGNTRNVVREGPVWAIEWGLPLRVWGTGWDDTPAAGHVVSKHLPNDQLAGLYRASIATLNDHWPDMRSHGFINNRIFDALACGLPVVSDWHAELAALELPGLLLYRDRAELGRCLETVLLDGPGLTSAAESAISIVQREFSFEHRVAELADRVAGLR